MKHYSILKLGVSLGVTRVFSLGILAACMAVFTFAGINSTPASAAGEPSLWCWSMKGGTVRGTFSLTPSTPGDGTAPAGTYTLTDMSVYTSPFSELLVGSISDETFIFGSQPDYEIVWDGTKATTFQRQNGEYTNGIGIYSNIAGKAGLTFDTTYESVSVENPRDAIYSSNTSPTLIPVAASGLCPGQSAPEPEPEPEAELVAGDVVTNSPVTRSDVLANTGAQTSLTVHFAVFLAGLGVVITAFTLLPRRLTRFSLLGARSAPRSRL